VIQLAPGSLRCFDWALRGGCCKPVPIASRRLPLAPTSESVIAPFPCPRRVLVTNGCAVLHCYTILRLGQVTQIIGSCKSSLLSKILSCLCICLPWSIACWCHFTQCYFFQVAKCFSLPQMRQVRQLHFLQLKFKIATVPQFSLDTFLRALSAAHSNLVGRLKSSTV
jgi:hypothetical protein